jgi:hypothetical protein
MHGATSNIVELFSMGETLTLQGRMTAEVVMAMNMSVLVLP